MTHNPALKSKCTSLLPLYLVTDSKLCSTYGLIETVIAAIEGGVTMVQLRAKEATDDELYEVACDLKHAIDGRVPLLLNDRVHIAKKADLDGAHIGQDDMSIEQARSILGPDKWLGLTVNNYDQLIEAQTKFAAQLDYVGVGPVFATNTKPNHSHPLGIEGLTHLVLQSSLPVVAIGGINLTNANEVYKSGCNGIAVVSAICAAEDPTLAARTLLAQIKNVNYK